MKNTNSLLRKLQNKNPKSQKVLLAGSMSALLAACNFENFSGFGGGASGANGNGNNVLTTGDGVSVNLGPNSGTISGGNGADMIRAAANVTISRGGAGKDIFVVLAKTSSAGYTEADLTNVNNSGVDLSGFITLSAINNNANADVSGGKVIDGQADGAILFAFGDTDFTNVGLFNITQLEINANVTIEAEMLGAMISTTGLVEIGGDNSSRLNITNEDLEIVIDLSGVSLHDINHLTVPQGVTLIVDQADLVDVSFIDGAGTLKAAFWELDLTGIQVGAGIKVTDAFDSNPNVVQTFTLDENQVDTGSFHFMGQNGVTYSLAGTDADDFNVNSSTGLISFKTAADAENATDSNGDNIYDLQIIASAQGYNSLSRDVRITVTNVNEGGPVFNSGAPTSLHIDENTSAVGNFNATDADLDDVVTYSLAGADAGRFNISSTGVVTFKTAPNAEIPDDSGGDNVYNVDIIASDTGGLTTTRSVAITVDNVNEFTPIFNAGSTVSVSVAENQTAVTTVAATDGDINETITYSLTGVDANDFVISSTGELTFNTAPDAETPADSDGDNIFNVTVVATDSGSLSSSRDVIVTLTDVDEFIPTFNDAAALVTSINENQTNVANVGATDADFGGSVTYSLTGADAAFFEVSATGDLTFRNAPDAENGHNTVGGSNVYNINIIATDLSNKTVTKTATVTVDNVNEFTPVFDANNTITVLAAENQTVVTNVAATDGDINEVITYSLTGVDAGDFNVSSTGVLTFSSAPDAETPSDSDGDNIFNVTVVATDSGSLSSSRDVIVNLTDIDEFTPTFNVAAALVTSINENQTNVANVGATDTDFGGSVTYSLTGADAAFFAVSVTGDLTFRNAPDAENGHNTVGGSNVYNINIVATDLSNKTVTKTATITVDNVNESSPIFTAAPAAISVNENQSAVTTIAATDADLGSTVNYSMASSGDSTLFNVNINTGVLTFISPPDHETSGDANNDNVYQITIIATDGVNNVSHNMTVTVNGVNEFNPVFAGGLPAAINVAENSSGAFQTFGATDGDHEDTITYTLTGNDALDFTIDSATGAVSFAANPNHENAQDANTDNVYEINIVATDSFSNSQSHSVAVTVTAVNEFSPTFSSPATINVNENQTTVGTFAAPDQDTIDTVTYSLVAGGDNNLFTINTATGAVVFATAPDREAPADANTDNIYNIQIVATDGTNTASHSVAVTVDDINDNAPIFASADPLRVGVAEGGTVGATVVATDGDSSDTVTYGSLTGVDAALFSIDAAGVVTFNAIRNISDNSFSGNDIYEITVNATGGGQNVSRDVSIGVGTAINGNGLSNDPVGTATAGIDIVDGGNGTDRLILAGVKADYTFAISGDDLVVTQTINNTTNVDWLHSIETLSFAGSGPDINVRDLSSDIAGFDAGQLDTWLLASYDHELF